MVSGIKSLIDMIQQSLPNCHVVVSEIIRRADMKHLNGKVNSEGEVAVFSAKRWDRRSS